MMRHDRSRSTTVGVVDAGSRFGARGGGSDCDRGDGGALVISLAGHRSGHGLRGGFDLESTGICADREMGWKRQVIVYSIRAISWTIVLLSFAWVLWWV